MNEPYERRELTDEDRRIEREALEQYRRDMAEAMKRPPAEIHSPGKFTEPLGLEERPRRGPMSADPQFRTVWAPDEFPDSTGGAVRFVPVTRRGTVVGYAWAAVTNDAAGFLPRPAAGGDGFNTYVAWIARLRAVKANGFPPLEALTRWAGAPEDDMAGHVAAGTEAEAATLDDLTAIAAR